MLYLKSKLLQDCLNVYNSSHLYDEGCSFNKIDSYGFLCKVEQSKHKHIPTLTMITIIQPTLIKTKKKCSQAKKSNWVINRPYGLFFVVFLSPVGRKCMFIYIHNGIHM